MEEEAKIRWTNFEVNNNNQEEVNSLRALMAETGRSLSESKKMIERLTMELERSKDSEKRLFDSFVIQTTELEQANCFIEKWKQKMASTKGSKSIESYWLRLQVERLENQLRMERNNGRIPWEEIKRLRRELETSAEAEENIKSAMDDLALALKEVALEASQSKEKLTKTENQIQAMKDEIETLNSIINAKEKENQLALTEAMKENESLKSAIAQLQNQAEKQIVKANPQVEKTGLLESFQKVRDETRKVRETLRKAKLTHFELNTDRIWPANDPKRRVKKGGKPETATKTKIREASCFTRRTIDEGEEDSLFDLVEPASAPPVARHRRSSSDVVPTATDGEGFDGAGEINGGERSPAAVDDTGIGGGQRERKNVMVKRLSKMWSGKAQRKRGNQKSRQKDGKS